MSQQDIADRVDLVKRASEATIEITRQLGAELTLTKSALARAREQTATITITVKAVIKERDDALAEAKALRAERDELRERLRRQVEIGSSSQQEQT